MVRAYAYEHTDNTLRSEVDYTPAVLGRMRDEELRPIIDIITDRATTHLASLADYGVTADTLTQLSDTFGKYKQFVPKPTLARTKRQDASVELDAKIDQANDILRFRMDDMVQILADTKPRFFRRYNNGRNIIDLRGSRPANFGTMKGVVKDLTTGVVIDGALVEIEGSDLIGSSDGTGAFTIDIAPGTYSIRVTHVDYSEFEQEGVVVAKGEETNLEILLEQMV